jgi:hypothetical protein
MKHVAPLLSVFVLIVSVSHAIVYMDPAGTMGTL